MAQTPDQIRENIAVLQDDILYLEHQLDDLDPDSPAAESKDRVIVVKWLLLLEQKALLQRHESDAPRRAAEARLAYHVENDTLDLY
jgi:hypothetical protein